MNFKVKQYKKTAKIISLTNKLISIKVLFDTFIKLRFRFEAGSCKQFTKFNDKKLKAYNEYSGFYISFTV